MRARKSYTPAEAAQTIGATRAQLQYWGQRVGAIAASPGRGVTRRFTFAELVEIAIARRLDLLLGVRVAALVMPAVRERLASGARTFGLLYLRVGLLRGAATEIDLTRHVVTSIAVSDAIRPLPGAAPLIQSTPSRGDQEVVIDVCFVAAGDLERLAAADDCAGLLNIDRIVEAVARATGDEL